MTMKAAAQQDRIMTLLQSNTPDEKGTPPTSMPAKPSEDPRLHHSVRRCPNTPVDVVSEKTKWRARTFISTKL